MTVFSLSVRTPFFQVCSLDGLLLLSVYPSFLGVQQRRCTLSLDIDGYMFRIKSLYASDKINVHLVASKIMDRGLRFPSITIP